MKVSHENLRTTETGRAEVTESGSQVKREIWKRVVGRGVGDEEVQGQVWGENLW